MDRRFFSKLLALGAGTLGLSNSSLPVAAQESEPNDSNPAPKDSQAAGSDVSKPPAPEPVNVYDFQALARQVLPQATYDYITTGSTDEVTLHDNVAAFRRIRLLPPLLYGVPETDTSTTVFKQKISLPILLAPVAGQSLYHRDGALASARAAAAAGTIFGVSSSAGHSVEEIAAASEGIKWFQLYVPRDRDVARRLVERVERAGYEAIIVTVDLGERKDADRRNRFALPRPALLKHLSDVGFSVHESMTDAELQSLNENAWDLALGWEFFDWLRSITKLPLLIKGVLRADDARKAVSIGLDGIVVSNHGGRRLDGVPASIDQLPQVVAAVAGRAEVFLDSGVRRGSDVFKALALGARAVLIGRPYAWALAADGERGVARVLELLREELVSVMLASGCENISFIDPDLLAPLRDRPGWPR